MRRIYISLLGLTLATSASAIVVENTSGSLEKNITSHDITSLTVTGTIDARDFKFIADSLTQLSELDLSQVQIEAYSNTQKPLVGTVFSFPANELPALVLMGSDITSIALPSTLVSVGNAALAGCTNLNQVTIPEGVVSIGNYAFSASGLTEVSLPASVVTVGEGAWARCNALTTATLNIAEVPAHAFMGDTALANVTLGNNVVTLGKSAFNGCTSLAAITVNEDNKISTIGTEAFIGADASEIHLSALPQLETVGNWAFASSGITSAILPNVSSLGDGAFFYTSSLAEAMLAQGITAVPDFAYAGSALNGKFTLPAGTEMIGKYAFYNDDAISVFTIPASVNYLSDWAMAGMTGLDTVNAVPNVVPELGDSVWAGVLQSAVMLNTADNDVADLYAAVDQWKEFHILRNYLMGDVNMDGTIDVLDINSMCAFVLGQPVAPFNTEAADMDKNGKIDIVDLNTLVSCLLSGDRIYIRKSQAKNGRPQGNTTTDCVTMHDLDINAGETATVELSLDNTRGYSAMQFDIDMPQGLSIVAGSLRATSRTTGHALMLSNDGNRIVTYSPAMTEISGNDGAIITMKVTASDAVQGTIEITNLIMATTKGERFYGTDSYAQVSSTTGVNDIVNNDKVYAYGNNIIIETENAGVAQIVAMNGTAQDIRVEAGHTEVNVPTGFYVVRLGGNSFKVSVK